MIRPLHYCSICGSDRVSWRVPPDDDRERHVCEACGEIHYQNPRVVAGSICEHHGRVLLCRRSIEPRQGYWTIPAGFMENHETVAQAASRETWEEARAETNALSLFALFNLPHISQVYMVFRSRQLTDSAEAGPESAEVAWFAEREIPWDELAFPVIHEALRLFFADQRVDHFPVHMADIVRDEDEVLRVRHADGSERPAHPDWRRRA